MVRRWLMCLLLFSIQATAWAELHLPDAGEVSLAGHWEMLHDPSGTMRLDDVIRPEMAAGFQVENKSPGLGYRKGSVWLRMTVIRPSYAASTWWLEVGSAFLDEATLYFPRGDGSYRRRSTGDKLPFAERDVSFRNPVFTLDLPADQAVTIYLRVRSTSTMTFPLVLWSPDAFVAAKGGELLILGMFYAVHLVLLIIGMWFHHRLGSHTYGLFSLFVLANMLTSLTGEGFIFQYLMPTRPAWNDLLSIGSFFASAPLGVAFISQYLGLYRSPWRRPTLGFSFVAAVFAIVAAPVVMLGFCWWLRPLNILWGGIATGILLVVAALLAWRGNKQARVVVLVHGILFVGVLLRWARNVGLAEPGFLIDNAYYLGMAAYLMVMNSAISRRYEEMRQEKDAAQAKALEISRKSEQELEAKVANRTRALKEAMGQVEVALFMERRAQEEQAQFLATVSHELRTPLAVIDATAQNLELDDTGGDPVVRARYEKILRATRRLALLLKDSLNEERFELLRKGAHPEPVCLTDLLADAANAAELLSDRHQIKVLSEDLPATFPCDANLMRLVLRSLADNAVKYTPAGSEVVLQGRATQDGVLLEVVDNGPGIPVGEVQHLFKRFYRGKNAEGKPGTGLGLALARRMVEMQGGLLTLNNTPGLGCRVSVFLPARGYAARA